ncbi:hypothetical protein QFC24_002251 [Naganishia onofrii]|uniref:Uncharacterized protein n=1 Tax=Naganishia onofrii TaxID=1851511 RepID=A0ACC2XPI6_9TREE|nr:hypothetical protein QFC24_002251 [Naganishia onofrii]
MIIILNDLIVFVLLSTLLREARISTPEYEGILISWDGKGVSTREYDGPAGFPDEPRDTNTSVSNTGDTALIISWKGEAVPSDHYTGPIDFQPDLLENKSSRLPTAASDNDLERHRVESPFDLDLDVLSPPQEPAHGEEAGAETPPQRTAAEFMETRIERSSLDDGDFVLDEDEEEPCTSEMSTTEPSGLGAMSGGWKGRLRPYHSGSKHSAKPESGSKCV